MENKELVDVSTSSIGLVDSHATDQYLTFVLDEEEYGIDILAVQEIRGWDKPTKLPNAPFYLKGVINLRGTIVPIMDLRARFDLPEIEYTSVTVVIVIKVFTQSNQSKTVGIIVDGVSDVYSIEKQEIHEPPSVSAKNTAEFIRGLTTVNDKMVIILELSKLFDFDALSNASDEELAR